MRKWAADVRKFRCVREWKWREKWGFKNFHFRLYIGYPLIFLYKCASRFLIIVGNLTTSLTGSLKWAWAKRESIWGPLWLAPIITGLPVVKFSGYISLSVLLSLDLLTEFGGIYHSLLLEHRPLSDPITPFSSSFSSTSLVILYLWAHPLSLIQQAVPQDSVLGLFSSVYPLLCWAALILWV